MVVDNYRIKKADDFVDLPEEEFNWSSVSLSQVNKRSNRLEASVFDIKAMAARQLLKDCKWPVVNLWSENGLITSAQYPNRFKRIYVEEDDDGVPFFLPSQITDINPQPTKFISHKTSCDFDELKAKKGQILLNRSGTIGPISVVNKTLAGKVFSDDVIRIKLKEEYDRGYVYAFLKTKTGQMLLKTNSYGAVISHIEPDHLKSLPIPNPQPITKQNIHNLVESSFEKRDESNELLARAEKKLLDELNLPPLNELDITLYDKSIDLKNYGIKLSELNNRLDASFHTPTSFTILKRLEKEAAEITTFSDNRISNRIILPGRFKRVYVEEGQGVVFLGGKQIYELDPNNKKYLSPKHHKDRIREELFLKENMTVITCSGTIGKVNIIPKHWENWTMNQHVMRILPASDDIAGFLFVWLNSEYGFELIKRYTYGMVVDEIHNGHMEQVHIPLLKNKETQKKINNLVLTANELRFEAYKEEQKAISMVNNIVIST